MRSRLAGDVRVAREQQRDVGQRTGRHERDRPLAGMDALGQIVHGVRRDRLPLRRRQVGPVEAGLAVDVGGDRRFADERAVGAGGDRDVVAAGELEDAQRVGRGLRERLVAGDRRDAEQLDLGTGEREQHRHRVVVAGIAVEQDRYRH
jgi:hypothetical protein